MARTCGWSHTYSRMSPPCVAGRPTTLATSSAAPPPKPITQSAPWVLNAAAPAITCAQVGSPNTPSNTATSRPVSCDLNSASTGNAASALSVTISGRLKPWSSRCGPTSLRAPAPKWIAVGKEKRVMVMRSQGSRLHAHPAQLDLVVRPLHDLDLLGHRPAQGAAVQRHVGQVVGDQAQRGGHHRAAAREVGFDADAVDQRVELGVAVAARVEGAATAL